ncbi:hypothetical protein ACEPAG_5761 [Sanghuangporus baumii]
MRDLSGSFHHHLNLLCKDIAKIDYFHPIVKNLRRIIKFFSNSTKASARLARQRKQLGISRGIEKIGKTRFGTLYLSALSVQRNYHAITELCKTGQVVVKDVNHLFMGGRQAMEFELGLQELTTALTPVAKAIKCLESTHSTVSDELIRLEVNHRFDQMVNNAPSDVYLTGFLLDPRFRGVDILCDLNPLVLQKLKIPSLESTGKVLTDNPPPADPALPETLRRVGSFLLGMLCEQYRSLKKPIAGLSAQDANGILRKQVLKYLKSVYPFDQPFHNDDYPGEWWKRLDMDQTNDAQPLAKLARSLFEVLPNSMVDEHTASTMKWFNSRLRNRQHVHTLVRMVKIRQWYSEEKLTSNPFRPTMRFRDMKETIFGTKRDNQEEKNNEEEIGETDEESIPKDEEDDSVGSDADENDTDEDETSNDEGLGKEMKDLATRPGVYDLINVKSPILLDILADEECAPIVSKGLEKGKGKKAVSRVEVKGPDMDLGSEDLWRM